MLTVVLFFLSCSHSGIRFDPSKLPEPAKRYYGSRHALGPRAWMIHEHGLPSQTGSKLVSQWEDLFSVDYPVREEVWLWEDIEARFQLPVEVWWNYCPPYAANGELRIELLDSCWTHDEFCMELRIDGLQMSQSRTLWRSQILIESGENRWWYVYDMSPVIGTKGLRALEATVFIPEKILKKYQNRGSSTGLLLFVVRDFLAGKERVALIQIPMRKGVNKR